MLVCVHIWTADHVWCCSGLSLIQLKLPWRNVGFIYKDNPSREREKRRRWEDFHWCGKASHNAPNQKVIYREQELDKEKVDSTKAHSFSAHMPFLAVLVKGQDATGKFILSDITYLSLCLTPGFETDLWNQSWTIGKIRFLWRLQNMDWGLKAAF